MKKFLIFFVALFTITFYLSSGNDSTKSSQADTAKNNSTSEGKGSFLTPKRTPVLLPLPNQSSPNIGGNSASASQKDNTSDTKPAAQTDKSTDTSSAAPTQTQADNQTACTPDSTNTCPTASTDTTPQAQPATDCNLSDPDNVIQQYQDNGQIVC
jgi:flagellum-specific peptidoglycan hydrolase FlgJ